MAGHSRWANVKHRKERADAKRGKIFTRLIREITVAARLGGGDPGGNPRLRLALEKAREQNLPGDNIQRAIQRGAGELDGAAYEEIRYEGYGPGGAAVMLECMTDNRTRTVAEVRHAFTKNGGNLGSDGSVAYLFKHCGQFVFAPGTSEEKVMDAALEAGAEDVVASDDGSIEVLSAPNDFHAVKAALDKAGLKPEVAEVTMKPLNETELAASVAIVHSIRDELGTAILLVEHVMSAVIELAERAIVLNFGKVLADGAPEVVMRDPEVVDAYLGKARVA